MPTRNVSLELFESTIELYSVHFTSQFNFAERTVDAQPQRGAHPRGLELPDPADPRADRGGHHRRQLRRAEALGARPRRGLHHREAHPEVPGQRLLQGTQGPHTRT